MSECAVTTCRDDATHEIGAEDVKLCTRHAQAWDANEDERIGRLHDLQRGDIDADMDAVFAEHLSEWLGAQR